MTDYLLQSARPSYWPHIDLTERVHRAYAERHGLKYVAMRQTGPFTTFPGWDKLPLLIDLTGRPDTGFVFYVDADAMAVGNTDPRTALGERLVGMSRHTWMKHPSITTPTSVNAGVIFLRACPQVHDWLEFVLDNAQGVWPGYEQTIMNESLEAPGWVGKYANLPHIWNSTVCLGHPADCEIRAWHGGGSEGERLARMREEMASRGLS